MKLVLSFISFEFAKLEGLDGIRRRWVDKKLKEGGKLKLNYFLLGGYFLPLILLSSRLTILCVILISSSGHPRLTHSASSWSSRQGIHDLLTLRHPGFLHQGIHDLLTLRHPDSLVRASLNLLMCLTLCNILLCKGIWGEEFIGFRLCGFSGQYIME